jgi:hypothetical protein
MLFQDEIIFDIEQDRVEVKEARGRGKATIHPRVESGKRMIRDPFSLLPVLFLIACQVSEESRIRELNQREEVWKERPFSLPFCISKDYQDKNEGIDQLQRRIEGYSRVLTELLCPLGPVYRYRRGNGFCDPAIQSRG